MKKIFGALFLLTFFSVLASAKTVLYIYDEVNEQSTPYIALFMSELQKSGFTIDKTAAVDASSKNLASYDFILIHGMVMAFTAQSPLRDWLKTQPNLAGRKVSLLVTANRWFLEKMYKEVTNLLNDRHSTIIDSVSSATKTLTPEEKKSLVQRQVAGLR